MKMNTEAIKAAFSDEAFVKSLLEMDTPEKVQTALEKKGVSLSLEDILDLKEQIMKAAKGASPKQPAEGELDEGALEGIAGGAAAPVLTDIFSPALQLTLDMAHGKTNLIKW